MPKYTTNPPHTETRTHKYCTSKDCERAGELLPLDDFFRDKHAPDGRTYRCKKCGAVGSRKYNQSEAGKIYRKKVAQTDKQKAAIRRYEQTEKGKLAMRKRQARRRQKPSHAPRELARHAVSSAVRSGILPRVKTVPCVGCGQTAKEYHHYLGYEPEHHLAVIPVCKACHIRIHHSATG